MKIRQRGFISWTERDLIWIKASLTLPAFEFLEALDQISSMSGRTVSAVASKARALRRDAEFKKAPPPPPPVEKPPSWTPSVIVGTIRPLTKEQMMGGDGRVANRHRALLVSGEISRP